MRDQRAVTHFHGAKDRYAVETALCERKTTVGVSVAAYGKAHSISERMPFEHILFYLCYGYYQNSASCILSTDRNIYYMKCLIMLQLP
jgi:hypothetical protein